MADVFDAVAPDKGDIFDQVATQPSIGQRALKNLPASALNFVKNLPSMMPGVPQGQGNYGKDEQGRPLIQDPRGIGEQIAAPFQSLWQTITNPGESFAQDPVGTVALPLMLLAGGRNALRAPLTAAKEGVKAAAPDIASGAAQAAAGELAAKIPGAEWPARIGLTYPGFRQTARGIRTGMETARQSYAAIPESERFHLLGPIPPPPGTTIRTPFKGTPPGMSMPDIEAAHQASVEALGKRFAQSTSASPTATPSPAPPVPPPPPNVDPKAWAELPDTVRNAIQEGAAKRAAGVGYTPPPSEPIPLTPPGPALKPLPAAAEAPATTGYHIPGGEERNPTVAPRELRPNTVINAQAETKNLVMAQRLLDSGMTPEAIGKMDQSVYDAHRISVNAERAKQGMSQFDRVRPGPNRRTWEELRGDLQRVARGLQK